MLSVLEFLLLYIYYLIVTKLSCIISVTAEKEGFVITETDKKGVFWAHKLAEIIVEVFDRADSSSLQVKCIYNMCVILNEKVKLVPTLVLVSHRACCFLCPAVKVTARTV